MISRREFIKIAGAGTVGAGAITGLTTNWWGLDKGQVHDPGTTGDKVIPTFCEMCFWKCGVLAHVKDGTVTKLEGNPDHPLSRGKLCPRGTGGTGLLYDPDRLRTPLVRTKRRGEQVFEAVSWDDALGKVADGMEKIRARYGPEALALYSHGFGGSWFKHLAKAFGTSNIAAPGEGQCRAAREVAFSATIGFPVGSPEILDMANSTVITLIGSHLGENMHNTQVQDFTAAITKGADVVVVDPRFSTAAGKARHWLPIKPGTDIALLLAWMNVIIEEKLYNTHYIETYTHGFEELKIHVKDKTPEWAFIKTTISPEKIRETARLIARPGSLIHPGRRTSWYGDDTQRGRAVAILNALVGAIGSKGGFYFPSSLPLPKYGSPGYTHEPKAPADVPKGQGFPMAESVLAHGVRDASVPGTADYDIKGWLVYGSNLIQSLPEAKRTLKAIQELDLLVSVDVLPMEITGWSDVVLPECTYLERYDDIHKPGYKEPYLALRQPVVEPMHDTRPGWWIAKELSRKLGLGEYFDFKDVETYLASRLEKGGYDFKELKRTGVIKGRPGPLYFSEGVAGEFDTPSGKIELHSTEMEEVGLPPLPDYVPPEEPEPDQFRLLFGRSPVHTFGRTTNNRFLGEISDVNALWLNRRVAMERGFKDGDMVVMTNQDGVKSEPLPLKATERIRHDCVFMVHGFGHRDKRLKFAYGRGASDTNMLTKVKIDPAMGGTGMNVNFVSVEKHEGGAA